MSSGTVRTRVLGLLLAASLGCGPRSEPRPRNVLLISLDTLRADHLGCYGYERDTSPSLDRLAAGGVRFADATTPSPWTLPAHASLLTGLGPSRHGALLPDRRLMPRIPTVVERFQSAGYRTKGLVTSFYLAPRSGLSLHLDEYEVLRQPHEDGSRPGNVDLAPEVTDRAIAWLQESRPEPFFLFLHYYDVHSDYAPDAEHRARFVRPYEGPADGTTEQLVELSTSRAALLPADVEHLVDLYDAEISQLDEELGRLFAFLDGSGLAAETLVVVTSDHGEEFYEHSGLLHGQTHYQEIVGVPLILRGPGFPAGVVVDAPVGLIDVAPTLLAVSGLEPLDGSPGVDLRRFLGSTAPERELFGSAVYVPDDLMRKWMVRRGGYKLLVDGPARKSELYDLRLDPAERTDVALVHPDVARELEAALERFQAGSLQESEAAPPMPAEELEALRQLGY